MTEMLATSIEGECDAEFAAVSRAFETNFLDRGEIGAAVCVYKDGRKKVDLWGGWADPETRRPWERDTIVCMMSVGKSLAALSVLILVDRGKINLEAPVARYWPEFAQSGKGGITVRVLISGQAGLLYADAAPDGSAYDWDVMIRAFETQAPEWEPGTRGGYHSVSAGYLFSELVQRVDGRSIQQFLAEEVTGPLEVDYRYGLAEEDRDRVANIIPNPESHTFVQSRDPTTKLGRAWRVRPNSHDGYNAEDYRRAVFPSSNGHGNARGVARIYAALACGGALDGVRLLSQEMIEEARREAWHDVCEMTDRVFRYGHGFFLNCPMAPLGANPRAFGHPGAGGALAFADPEGRIAFSYSPNLMCAGGGVGDRCEALVASAYQ